MAASSSSPMGSTISIASSLATTTTTTTSSSSSSSSSSPCAACKFLRRKCQPDCVFAPYFPPDNPQKFIHVHRVFGASNVTKLLNELHPYQREDAVNSLAYEADMRLRDPVYGCVGVISVLQHQLRQLQIEISCAKSELSKYQSTFGPPSFSSSNPPTTNLININAQPTAMGSGIGHFFPTSHAREPPQPHLMMMRNSYDTYDDGLVAAAMNASAASFVPFAGGGQFARPNAAAAADDRPGIGPSEKPLCS
ncbi:Lateral organ boundaries LOB domain-containing protein [Dioscorea alata]|uniref:Lateral organ boundaries LOB domain-containing protein n=1 Tax=Dioscorea alata TaxID=55571 RepID=A0ACB7WBH5_DIOAL|nr:Lateral organ boundaries LOB domain-containing protein [Dioscorea alata]